MSEGLPYPVVPRPALIRELSRHHGDPHDLPVPEVNVVPPTPLHADHEARYVPGFVDGHLGYTPFATSHEPIR